MKKIYLSALLGFIHFFLSAQTEFITTWKTDNSGTSANNQITIPTFPGEVYDYIVDWGDGSTDNNVTGDITHTYATQGTYTVSITGDFPRIYFNFIGDNDKLLTIEQWGTIKWSSMEAAFAACHNLNVVATDTPDLTNVTSMKSMFDSCSFLQVNESINDWDTSTVTDMSFLFASANSFNTNINQWNTSNVIDMSGMFIMNDVFNQPIGVWNTSNVQNMGSMFNMTGSFNEDIGNWDVSKVNDMSQMFEDSQVFNQPLDNWNVSSVKSMRNLFKSSQAFNHSVNNWDVSSVTDMTSLFEDAASFDQNLGNWDVGQVASMIDMFRGTRLSQDNYDSTLIGWVNLDFLQSNVQFDAGNSEYCVGEISRLVLMENFNWTINDNGKNCPFITTWKTDNPGFSNDNQISISTYAPFGTTYNYDVDWGDGTSDIGVTGNIVHTYSAPGIYQIGISGEFPRTNFNGNNADSEKLLQINQWGSIQWTSMAAAFIGCSNLDVLAEDIPNLSNVSTTSGMFSRCTSLVGNEYFQNWEMGNVTITDSMFALAEQFNQDVSSWDVSNVTSMFAMFNGATSFNQDIGLWNVGKVINMGGMFANSIFNQDISAWNVSNVVDMEGMFSSNRVFNKDISTWNVSNVTDMLSMFQNAESFNQDLSAWDVSKVQHMTNMFNTAISFNSNVDGWDVSNVEDMVGMFQRASSFNQDLGSWNVTNVTNMMWMFAEATNFDQSLENWNIQNVNNMGLMFEMSGLSLEKYDRTLNNWAELPSLQIGVSFDAGSSQYCESEEARQNIINMYGWTINDAGENPVCNQDNDSDGVLDHKDSCLGTPPGVEVDANGCDIIPNNAIKVYVLTPSCIGSSDGIIEITMNISGYLLDISISGEGLSNQFDDISSETGLEINDLSAGSYTITVSIPEIFFEQTYGVTVNELDSVTGKRAELNSEGGTVSYSVEGSTSYSVSVNGETKDFVFENSGQQTISLKNLKGQTQISITGENDCQGKILDSFFIGETIQVYPTVTSTSVNFITEANKLKVYVFGVDGRLIKEQNYNQQEKSMDVSSFESGMYFLQMEIAGHKETIKIVKR
ncbi:BspA family leucine-rich repeat surface protein [Flagellimonas sp.]|uniref:BspA family leucine-rich repeat surface protein n=1 Tax=Flagellimonas sp. TaxID=2058762 RepID=UPI003B5BC449